MASDFSKFCVVMVSVASSFAFAQQNDCIESLQEHVKNDPDTYYQATEGAYACGDVGSACFLTYESQRSPFPSRTNAAFLDTRTNTLITWATLHEGRAFAKIPAGRRACADVYIYFSAEMGKDDDEFEVSLSKETARDAMFCPFGKKFFDHRHACRKL